MIKKSINYNLVNLVNDRDEIIGNIDKFKAHEGKAMLHQAISLFMFRKNSFGGFDLLVQKRSPQKIVGANQWANTLCANVMVGENHRQCLQRRLREELGITLTSDVDCQIQEITVLNYATPCNQQYSEREIDHLFALVLTDQQFAKLVIEPNPIEVSEIRWVDWLELSQEKKISGLELTPWFNLFLQENQVMQAIKEFLNKVN